MRRVLLVILMVLQVLSAAFEFFILLAHYVLLAVVSAALSLLGIVLILSVIINADDIEDLRTETHWLRERMKRLEESLQGPHEADAAIPALKNGEVSRGVWECVKCGTVNKAGTSQCINCKSEYSSWINPTDTALKKKKISRWVKYK